MTITPTDPSAGAPAGIDPAGTSAPAAAGDFLAAILQALAPSVGPTAPTQAGATDPAADEPTAGAPGTVPAPDPAALGLVLPAGLVGQLAVVVPTPSGGAATVAGATAPSGAVPGPAAGPGGGPVVAAPAPGPAKVAAGTDAQPLSPTRDIRRSSEVGVGRSGAGRGPTAAVVPALPGPSSDGGAAAVPTGPVLDTLQQETQPAPQQAATQQPATQQPAPQHPITPSPATTTSPIDTGGTSVPQVTRQVFPDVTSLVTRGDGVHRITLTLKPEALGEVRVVMTVRDGSVHVRLAGGPEAQQALRDGSHELTRLLEAAGASESRIVVRDLAAAPASTSANGPAAASATGTATGSATDLGTGGQRPQDQHAGTRAHHPATDGTHDGTRHRRDAHGATEPRSNEPVTRTRTAGVDVTM